MYKAFIIEQIGFILDIVTLIHNIPVGIEIGKVLEAYLAQ